MPPQITDDEASASDASSNYGALAPAPVEDTKAEKVKKEKKGKSKTPVDDPEPMEVESDNNDDDEEIAEDEYVVEKITNHIVDEDTGELKFEVKWEGFEKKSDRTWEPEQNLETAPGILSDYLDSVGGKEAIMAAYEEAKVEAASGKKGKKRGRASTGAAETNGSKRGRKSHPASTTPPASSAAAEFKPPTGSWEDAVVAIDACEGNEGSVVVYLTWKGGYKTQHPLPQVYKRCPQKMLQFYESHLVFKKNEDMA